MEIIQGYTLIESAFSMRVKDSPVIGLVNVRNQALPLIDVIKVIEGFVSVPRIDYTKSKAVVAKIEEREFAFVIDELIGILKIPIQAITPPSKEIETTWTKSNRISDGIYTYINFKNIEFKILIINPSEFWRQLELETVKI